MNVFGINIRLYYHHYCLVLQLRVNVLCLLFVCTTTASLVLQQLAEEYMKSKNWAEVGPSQVTIVTERASAGAHCTWSGDPEGVVFAPFTDWLNWHFSFRI
jgi:hypothetical protein